MRYTLPVLVSVVFLFSGCNMFNKPLSDFLEYWTDVAQITRHTFDGSYPATGGLTNLPSGGDRVITYYLVNPQNYDLEIEVTFDPSPLGWDPIRTDNYPGFSGPSNQGTVEQDATDKSIIRLTLNKNALASLDGTGTEISPTVSIMEPKSGRDFGSYSIPLLVNSAPPAVTSPIILYYSDTGDNEKNNTYVICFNMPDMNTNSSIHRDIVSLTVSGFYDQTYTVTAPPDSNGNGLTGVTNAYNDTNYKEVTGGGAFFGDKNNRFVGIETGVSLNDVPSPECTITLTDSSGATSVVTASTEAPPLPAVTASPGSGTIEPGDTVTFSQETAGSTVTLGLSSTDGVFATDKDGHTLTFDGSTVTDSSGITLTFVKKGTYTVTATAGGISGARDTTTTFTYTVPYSAVYVAASGSDTNGKGTQSSPYATLDKAMVTISGEGVVYVTGNIAVSSEQTHSSGSLTLRGYGGGGTLTNDSGRVLNITGGSVTLGDGITLTGQINSPNARGGAVYVTGGNFTMESGSTIADSHVQGASASGGGVYVMNGTFIMEDGSKITGSSADISGGGVAVSTDGIFTMRGGIIGGTGADANNAESGGGVVIYNATFTMEGGTITGNSAKYGGGIRVDSGEFIMEDGTISDNNATSLGGGVFIQSITFNMEGGTIKGNEATGSGGGVYVNSDGTFTMSDGTIGGTDPGSANSASSGGGVYVNSNGEFTMSGGTINDDIFAGESFALNGAGLVLSGCDITLGSGVSIDVSGVDKNNIENVGVSLEDAAQGKLVLENVADIETCIKFSIKNYTDGDDSLMWINYSDGQGILQDIGGTFNEKPNTTPIFTSADLVLWAEKVNDNPTYADNNCLLYTDINLSAEWTPVYSSNSYNGTFDGNGHTISGLSIGGNENYQGLFSYVGSNGTIKNLTLSNVDIHGNENVGGVAGYNLGKILGCTVSGTVKGDSKACGGIAGFSKNGFIIGCASSCSVTGDKYVGGVVGQSTNDSIVACYNKGSIKVITYVAGGVVGGGISFELYGCYSSCGISAPDTATIIGGIAGDYTSANKYKALYYSNYEGDGIGNKTATTTKVDEAATTWLMATDEMNAAIIEWNASNEDLCDWKFQQNDGTNNPPVLVPGAP